MVGDDMHADEAGWSREDVRTSLNPDGLAFIVWDELLNQLDEEKAGPIPKVRDIKESLL